MLWLQLLLILFHVKDKDTIAVFLSPFNLKSDPPTWSTHHFFSVIPAFRLDFVNSLFCICFAQIQIIIRNYIVTIRCSASRCIRYYLFVCF